MNTDELLEKIGKLFEAEREHTKELVGASEKRLKRQLKKMESAIVLHFDSRAGDHEKRIRRLEEQVEQSHQN